MATKYTITDKEGKIVCSFVEATIPLEFLELVAKEAEKAKPKKKVNNKAVAHARKTGGE